MPIVRLNGARVIFRQRSGPGATGCWPWAATCRRDACCAPTAGASFPGTSEGRTDPVVVARAALRPLPGEFHAGATLKKVLRRGDFHFTFDRAFAAVIRACALPRPGQPGTWITPDMRDAYSELHRLGYAHSLEAWNGSDLAGGLYGISLGNCFFAESMFHFDEQCLQGCPGRPGRHARRDGFHRH